jgi:hypothetical protein
MSNVPKRVTISYTVDFKEVPERASIMLKELSNALKHLSVYTEDISNVVKDDAVEGLREMDRLKVLLEKAETRVQDISLIAVGYIEILRNAVEAKKLEEAQEPKKKKAKKKAKTSKKKKKEEE